MKLFACALAVLLAAPFQCAHGEPQSRPKILVVISVDQFSADLFAEYRGLFTAGLKRLQGGAVFPSGYQSHAATETCPGHSTLLTGLRPARTGIIANEWYDLSLARQDKKVYCAEDPSAPNSSAAGYTVSANLLNARTLGDRLKAINAQSRVVAVAGKDRAALMMGGHAMDQVWFTAGSAFVSWPAAKGPAPKTIETANAAIAAAIAKPAAASLPAPCQSRAVPLPLAGRVIGVLHDPKPGEAAAFKTSLAFDRAITDVATGLIREMQLGSGPAVDVLAIGLSATDYVGHTFGTEGAEMCAQLFGVDDNVGRILQALDATHVAYALVLTADHGGHDLPERNQLRGMQDAVRVDPDLLPGKMSQQLAAELNLRQPLLSGTGAFGDIYVARDLPESERARVLQAARAKYLAHPQVAAVFTAADLNRMPLPGGSPDEWSLAQRFRASFDARRSGDLLIALKPHVTPIPDARGAVATHGSAWNYDRRVPILFYLPGTAGFEQPLPVETVDIMPTLAALIGLSIPAGEVDGHCLDLDPGPRDTCRPPP
jgi:predicted AlkP superfamily pyrophosphatase or phosphodiesterase